MPPRPSCSRSSYLPMRRGLVLIGNPSSGTGTLPIIHGTGSNIERCQSLNVIVNLHYAILHVVRIWINLSNKGIVCPCEQIVEEGQGLGLQQLGGTHMDQLRRIHMHSI